MLSPPWRPYKLTRSKSPCTRKSWRVSVLASRVVSTELITPVLYVPANSSQGARKLIVTKPHLLFSFCARVGWRDVCTEFTNLIKVDVDVNGCHYQIFNLRNIREIHLFDRYMIIFLTKMRTKTKTVPSNWYIFNVQRCTHTDFHMCRSYIVIGLHEEPENFYREKRSVTPVTGNLFTFFGGFISRRFGDYANINMWKSDYMKTWNSLKCNDRIFKLSSSFMLALKIYKIQRRKLRSAKRKRYQFSFSHP